METEVTAIITLLLLHVYIYCHAGAENSLLLPSSASNFMVQNFSIVEESPTGTYIGQLFTTNPIGGQNALPNGQAPLLASVVQPQFAPPYTIHYSNESARTSLNVSREGVIRVRGRTDREARSVLTFVAESEETGGFIRASVYLTDINDNAPTFRQTFVAVTISEGAPLDVVLLTDSAHDRDEGINGVTRYEIVTAMEKDRDMFSLVESSASGNGAPLEFELRLNRRSFFTSLFRLLILNIDYKFIWFYSFYIISCSI